MVACGGDSSDGVEEPGEEVAFEAPGTSKGFRRSRPSALTRGVSCSSTDGHSLIIGMGKMEVLVLVIRQK